MTFPLFETHPPRVAKQHNLIDLTKFKLYRPPYKPIVTKGFEFDDDDDKKAYLNFANF